MSGGAGGATALVASGARGRPGGRSRFTPGAAILALVVVALLVALAVPVRTLLHQRSDLARIDVQAQVLERRNATLQQQLQQLHDPAYLERIARGCLGMVKRGEIAFVVVPKGGTGSGPATDPLVTAQPC